MNNIDQKEISKIVLNAIETYSDTTYERAFANLRDGFKQSHRRLIYSIINVNGDKYNGRTVKTASIIGECLPIHPHGDQALYGTLVKMAQVFGKYPYPLIDGTSNYGSHSDPKSFASMRYTETKSSEFAYDVIFKDYNSKIVDFKPSENFEKMEPVWLSTRIPLILVEGTEGIAEAFISSIPSHNLSDVVRMCIEYIKNPSIKNEDLVDGLFPDFPCGGVITNGEEIQRFYKYGEQCSIQMKGILDINRDEMCITIKEFPYGSYYKKFKDEMGVIGEKNNYHLSKVENIIDDKSEEYENFSTGKVYCNKDANLYEISNIMMNKTSLRTSMKLSFKVFDDNIVKTVTVKDIIEKWFLMRSNYIQNSINYKKNLLEVDVHIMKGMLKIYDYTDEIIALIRSAEDKDDAMEKVLKRVPDLSKIQAKYIVEMQLHRLSKISKSQIETSISNNLEMIEEMYVMLGRIPNIIIEQLIELDKKYKRPRRTKVLMNDIEEKQEIDFSNKVLVYSRNGYLIHDIDSFINNKSILNGLNNIKINNTNYKELIGYEFISKNIIGFGLFYSNGDYLFFNKNRITSINHWMNVNATPDSYLVKMIPFYSDDDYLAIISNERKLKKVSISELKSKAGKIFIKNCIYIEKDFVGSILAMDENGNYLLSAESDQEFTDYPILNKKASGVNSKFDDVEIYMLKIYPDDNFICIFSYNKTSLQSHINTYSINNLLYNGRTNKLKNISKNTELAVTGIGNINLPSKNKDYETILISKTNLVRYNSRNLKFINEYKNINIKGIGSIQFEK